MKLIIDIDDKLYKDIQTIGISIGKIDYVLKAIKNGTPLPKYTKELKRRLFMEVDGGTDDKYLRYTDVCDRISNTIDTYVKAESEESNEVDN